MKTIRIARVSHAGMRDGTHIDIEVRYHKDAYRGRPRGFYLSAQPVTPDTGYTSYVLGSGKSVLLFEASRFSEKKMDQATTMGKVEMPALIEQLLTEQVVA